MKPAAPPVSLCLCGESARRPALMPTLELTAGGVDIETLGPTNGDGETGITQGDGESVDGRVVRPLEFGESARDPR